MTFRYIFSRSLSHNLAALPMSRPNGAILYRGVSLLDNRTPVVVVITGIASDSDNAKTGDMLQAWILTDDDTAPHVHVKNGTDRGICGTCPFASGRGCYVKTFHAPWSVWAAVRRGAYPDISNDPAAIAAVGANRAVRLGAYGDPAAVPLEVWRLLTARARKWTGYTHEWRNPRVAPYRAFLQASCETPGDVARAESEGWGTFLVAPVDVLAQWGEPFILCPASEKAGRVTNCATCGLCNGADGNRIAIPPHGSGASQVSAISRRRSLPTLALA